MIRGTRSEKLKCSNQQMFGIRYTGEGAGPLGHSSNQSSSKINIFSVKDQIHPQQRVLTHKNSSSRRLPAPPPGGRVAALRLIRNSRKERFNSSLHTSLTKSEMTDSEYGWPATGLPKTAAKTCGLPPGGHVF